MNRAGARTARPPDRPSAATARPPEPALQPEGKAQSPGNMFAVTLAVPA